MKNKPYVLLIRDGWGYSQDTKYNAVYQSNPVNHNKYIKEYPTEFINASGLWVGLPEGNQGSSEVGHLNIGAGRVVYQNLVKINKDIKDDNLKNNNALLKLVEHIKKFNGNIHIYGLVQDQGVHAHTNHLIGYLKALKFHNISSEKIYIHVISDGRDTPPQSTEKYIKVLDEFIQKEKYGHIVSITGRYYAMDRDNRWERVKLFYDLLTKGKSEKPVFDNVYEAVKDAYSSSENDEFIKPRIIKGFVKVKDNDAIIFFNYRFDRAREITKAFVLDNFSETVTKELEIKKINNLFYLCTTEYYEGVKNSKKAKVEVVYPLEILKNLMGEVISNLGLKQLRIAETEKFAHVTFFFNGQQDIVFKGEDRILVQSPKVATYDMKPEMSAYEVTDKMLEALDKEIYSFIVLNFANPDMVGHTGNFEAAIKACKVVDECVGKVVNKVLEKDGVVFLTSDHGNAETMVDPVTGKPQTAHTSNPVWFTIISNREELQKDKIKIKKDCKLADISPTILHIMGYDIPEEMTGKIMIEKV